MELYFYLIVLPIILLLIRPLYRKSNHRKMPPGPAGFPILGSLPHLEQNVHKSLYRMSLKHGPLMTVRLGAITSVVASTPEAAREILGKYEPLFTDRPIPDAINVQPHLEYTLAWVDGDQAWRNRRRTCTTQLFSPQRLNALQPLRQEKVQQLLRYIEKNHLNTGEPLNIGNVAFATNLNLLSSTVFSTDVVDPEFSSAQEFKNLVWAIMEDAGAQNISDAFPILKPFDLQGIRRRIKGNFTRFHEIFEEVIQKRMKDRADGSTKKHGDFLDALLDRCEEEGSGFDRLQIKPLLLDIFVAGSDTTAITTEWAMSELLRHPDVLKKARQELLTVIGADQDVDESDMDRLPYLQAVVKETLRLHPPAPVLLYKAKTDSEVFGYTIPNGIRVLVNAYALSRDPNHWPEPEKFDPERFMGSNVDYKGRYFEYLPFGAGRRICPGLPLASRMVHLLLASLIKAFNWRFPEGTTPETLDMEERFGVSLKKANSLFGVPSLD